jgi:DNA helicase-2/ATP-dependent DNA helicase PcrA
VFREDSLNPEQRSAAEHRGGPLLVLAGAGTGKTATLSARVASLLGEGVEAQRILLLTFTRRAAREMIGRTASLIAERANAGKVTGGTFHSIGHRFVRSYASALGLPADFGLLDAGDAADVLDLVRNEHGHPAGGRRFPRKQTLADIYTRTINAQRPVREIVAELFPWCEEHVDAVAEVLRGYAARKRSLGVLDLDDLLLHWRALVQDERTGGHIAGAFDHVLVDEYQDVNGIQADIVRHLHDRGCSVTAVGDDFQAIYSFRSASVEHILGFPQRFAGTTTVTLDRNYRGTQPLLDVANAVSAQDTRGYRKVLRATRPAGTRPQLVRCRDQSQEAELVCDQVLADREDGLLLREQAVLARTGHDTDLLELELSRRRIPYVKYGGLRFLEAAHVKDFLAALRLADVPADEMSWFRLLQLAEGVGPGRSRRVLDVLLASGERPGGLWERWPAAAAELPASARSALNGLAQAIRAAHGADLPPGPAADRLRAALDPLVRSHYPDGAVRMQDLSALVTAAGEAPDLRTFFAEVLLDPPASTQDLAVPPHLDEDWLVLSTVHSAKGLEWQSVHLIAAYDGNFPADMAAGSAEGIAEERRLLYVALTRARRSLRVYAPQRYYHRPGGTGDTHGYGKISRFLDHEVQRLFDIAAVPADSNRFAPSVIEGARVRVDVDELFA